MQNALLVDRHLLKIGIFRHQKNYFRDKYLQTDKNGRKFGINAASLTKTETKEERK